LVRTFPRAGVTGVPILVQKLRVRVRVCADVGERGGHIVPVVLHGAVVFLLINNV